MTASRDYAAVAIKVEEINDHGLARVPAVLRLKKRRLFVRSSATDVRIAPSACASCVRRDPASRVRALREAQGPAISSTTNAIPSGISYASADA